MEVASKLTSKGQVTIPKSVRSALDLRSGDSIIFKVEKGRAVITKTADFIDLAGQVDVPGSRRDTAWSEIIDSTRASRLSPEH